MNIIILITCRYWGKRDAKLNLPTNSSLSVTLSQADLKAHTTAACSPSFPNDSLMLNSSPQDIAASARTQACLRELRVLRRQLEEHNPRLPPLSTYKLKLVSINNFPTAAGLASSAAGFAALVRAIADLYELPHDPTDLSRIARQGSGSACRSLFGGYVAWDAGKLADGSDSVAVQVATVSQWPTMRALIVVISDAQKEISSTVAMQLTATTSALFTTRATDIVPHRMHQMEAAIDAKDFSSFGLLCMRDSNTFHATCADTWPPVFYMTDASRAAIRMVEAVNKAAGEIVCAYTFDAGPNAVIFYEEEHEASVLAEFRAILGHVPGWRHNAGQAESAFGPVQVDEKVVRILQTGVKQVIMTGVGGGPMKVDEHLVSLDGMVLQNPKRG